MCALVCIYGLGGKGKLAEPLRQVVHSSNANSVKFLSCHRNKDSDSPLSYSQMTQYFTHVQISLIFGTLLVKSSVTNSI